VQGRERKAVEAMTATQNAAANLIAERDQLRKDVLVARNEREDAFKKSVELTDELHQSANELRTLKDKSVTLGQDIAKYNELKRLLNIANVDAFLQKTPPDVKGRVLTVDGTGLVEISLGVDDGLQKGHRLEVYRTGASGATYLGKVEVVEAVPERAVCKIVREFQKGTVQKGDHVASKL
jgi:hypothetical protein